MAVAQGRLPVSNRFVSPHGATLYVHTLHKSSCSLASSCSRKVRYSSASVAPKGYHPRRAGIGDRCPVVGCCVAYKKLVPTWVGFLSGRPTDPFPKQGVECARLVLYSRATPLVPVKPVKIQGGVRCC